MPSQVTRCFGAGDELLRVYHDREWGRPVVDERRLYEKLCLEALQSGLSWTLILRKREGLREALDDFDPEAVARYGPRRIERLLADARVIRNRRKLEAIVANARATLALRDAGRPLAEVLWELRPAPRRAPRSFDEVPAFTEESKAIARELKRAGFVFLGPTTVYATMQAVGLVNDHLADCFVRADVEREQRAVAGEAPRASNGVRIGRRRREN